MSETVTCLYWGLFFDKYDFQESTLERDIADKHVTFGYQTPFPKELLGKPAKVLVCGYASDGRNEAVEVVLDDCSAEFYHRDITPHVTLSVSEDGAPSESAHLPFVPISTYEVEGVFGYFGFDDVVHVS